MYMSKVSPAPPKTTEKVIEWFHGFPVETVELRRGSTITPDRVLAEVFGRKPNIASLEDYSEIRHEGTSAGFLYIIDEHLSPADMNPHSNSSMKRGARVGYQQTSESCAFSKSLTSPLTCGLSS